MGAPSHEPRPVDTSAASPSDMDDRDLLDALKARWKAGDTRLRPLVEGLDDLNHGVLGAFREADDKANALQRSYRRCAFRSTLAGAIAVMFGLFQLAHWESPLIVAGEFIFAVASLGYALYGVLSDTRERWLLERALAERLRARKFASLLDPRLWQESTRADWTHEVAHLADDFPPGTHNFLEDWTLHQTMPRTVAAPEPVDRAVADELRLYYRRQRIGGQIAYLTARAPEEHHREVKWKLVGLTLFYTSVGAVFAHALLSIARGEHDVERILVYIAAGAPAMAAVVRTYRAGREFGRNALRHTATLTTLRELDHQLERATTTAGIFSLIGACEQVLEADTREWMRLMKETEWFG